MTAAAAGTLGTTTPEVHAATDITCDKIRTQVLNRPPTPPASFLGSVENCTPFIDDGGPYVFHVRVLIVDPISVPPSGGMFPRYYYDQTITCAEAWLSDTAVQMRGCTYA
ncbi:hypothetical protein [Streptomyces beigongshangae]|uniref:hypothetical protein n=1 Tax=Streptomyces beigongshangae TaxID=2841597 RepID=UPI001C861065|nr:hypothetical protein [Streptomyces sp. REN17]